MNFSSPLLLATALTLSIAACSRTTPDAATDSPRVEIQAPTIVAHAQGETRIEGTPQTVFVTDWASFDTLTALGVPVAAVPGGHVPGHLADKVDAGMQRIGSMQQPDIEAIAAAAPDLVMIGGRSRGAYPTLSKIAPTIDASVDNGSLLQGLVSSIETDGRIFGREARAEQLVAELEARVERARAAARGKGTALVIVTNGGRIGIYGPQSRVSWIYTELGVPSVFSDVDDREHGGDAINLEYLVKTDPDWLFVIDRDAGVGNAGAAQALLDNPLIHQAGFWKNDRIVHLDSQAAYVTMHGYGAVSLLLDQVATAFETK